MIDESNSWKSVCAVYRLQHFWCIIFLLLICIENKTAAGSRLKCSFPSEEEFFLPPDFYFEVRGSGHHFCYSLGLQQRRLLLNREQLVCPQQCNRIWERPAGHYHHRSVWPTKSAKALPPTAVSAKQLLRARSKLLQGLDLSSEAYLIQCIFKAAGFWL